MLRFLARFVAVVLAAAFVMATVVAVFVRPLGTRMLAPQTYKDVLREQRVAERFPELAAETITKAVAAANRQTGPEAGGDGAVDFGAFLSGFSPADLQTLIGAVLPADYVRAQTDGAIDQFFGYVNSAAAQPSVVLSFTDLKQRLAGGVLEDAYVQVLQGKPPCGPDTKALPSACCPPADQLLELRRQFRDMVGPAVQELPDRTDLFAVRESSQAEAAYAMMAQVRNRARLAATLARWSWVLPAGLLVGVAVFGVRSFRGLLLWWGIPCLLAGGFALVCALPGALLGDWCFRVFVKPALPPEVPVLAVEAVLGVVTSVAGVVLGAALKAGLWLAGGGLAAVVVSFFFKTAPTPPAAAVAPALPVV